VRSAMGQNRRGRHDKPPIVCHIHIDNCRWPGACDAGSSRQAQGTANPPQIVKDNMERMAKNKLEKCFGINAAAKNDCAEGAHSCAGQATQARDTKSFVLLPAGDCGKIQGGKTTAT